MSFDFINPITIYSNLLGYTAELCYALCRTLDNLIRIGNAKLPSKLNQVFVSDVNSLSSDSKIVGWIKLVSRIETRECQVICRCYMPRSTFLHHEGEVADVCINISSKDVEYSASESFFFFFVWNIEFVYDGHQILIVPGIRIHGS